MSRYKVWDGVEPIVTPVPDPTTGKQVYTPEEYKTLHPILAVPGVKLIISNGTINGAVHMEASHTASVYRQMGADIGEDATAEDIAEAIEAYEDFQKLTGEVMAMAETENAAALQDAQLAACEAQVQAGEAAERQAAAAEFLAMMALPETE